MIACGTAAYAGMVGKYAIEDWARIPVDVELAHEFRYRDPVLDARTLVVSISQSGETMDTLMAVKYARERGRPHGLDLQHPGRDDPARVRCRGLHARRSRGRGRVDEGLRRADRPRSTSSASTSRALRGTLGDERIAEQLAELEAVPAKLAAGRSRRPGPGRAARALDGRHPVGALPRPPRRATRSRSKARSSSRSSPTSTPRASRPASSSTGRSR